MKLEYADYVDRLAELFAGPFPDKLPECIAMAEIRIRGELGRLSEPVEKEFGCAKCGKPFKSLAPRTCGMAELRNYVDGDPVPDVLLYICDDCAKTLPIKLYD